MEECSLDRIFLYQFSRISFQHRLELARRELHHLVFNARELKIIGSDGHIVDGNEALLLGGWKNLLGRTAIVS